MIIPFFIPHSGCPHQCVFCNQKNITGRINSTDPFSIPRNVEEYLSSDTSSEPAQIAFYGGTFTALSLERQRSYLQAAQPFIQSGKVRSIRLSTRPDYINSDILKLLKTHHVETVELGVQSMNDGVLNLSGRGHTVLDTVNAVNLLKEYGLQVGMQLMLGLPGDSAGSFMDSVHRTIELNPTFVRIYPTLVIKDTPLEKLYKSGLYAPLSIDDAVPVCKEALLLLEAAGINVIRIGLQPAVELEKPGNIIAGPYHPAFRQLVESAILLRIMQSALAEKKAPRFRLIFRVNPADISAAVGQKRSNIESLKKQFGLNKILVQPDETLQRRKIRLIEA